MKRIISAVLTVLICVLTLCGCEKTPTVQESGSGSSFAESNEASVSGEAESDESEDNEEELRSAAKEMGYFDEQINEIIGYGFTLEQLLSPEENNSTNIEMFFSPDGNYALGGYWYFDGERGCAYLKNLKSGKITVFSECLNRYSHYGFTSNGNIYFFDYALSAEKQSVLNFYSPENIKSPYDYWLPDSDGTLIWVRTDYIASEDALLTFWVNVEADFFPDGNSVYPQYNYSSALIHCDNLTIEELNTKIPLQTNKYGQIVTPELDRRDNGDKRVILLDSAYRIDFSPFTISLESD